MMYGFSQQRQQLLEAELRRLAEAMPPLGAMSVTLTGEMAVGRVGPQTGLEMVVVQQTDEPFHRRSGFWVTHLRPRLDTTFHVYTPDEVEALAQSDSILAWAQRHGEVVVG